MKLIKPNTTVTAAIYVTYVTGIEIDSDNNSHEYKDCIFAKANESQAENYLNSCNDNRIVITHAETKKERYTCDIDDFMRIAKQAN